MKSFNWGQRGVLRFGDCVDQAMQVCWASGGTFEMVGSGNHTAAVTKARLPFLFADGFGFVGATTLQDHKAVTKPLLGGYRHAGRDAVWAKGKGAETLCVVLRRTEFQAPSRS